MPPEELPVRLSSGRQILEKLDVLASELGLSRQELALGYLKARMPQAKLIIGVDTAQQIMVNVNAWRKDFPATFQMRVLETFDSVDEKILNPSMWSN